MNSTQTKENMTKDRLLRLLMKRQYRQIREETDDMHPADVAELLEDMDENNRLVVFRILSKETAAQAFSYMSDEARNDLVDGFSDAEIVQTLEEMSLDDAADMLEDMPASVVKRVLEKSGRDMRDSLNRLLHYPESSAGSIMTPEYLRFRKGMTVQEAFRQIRDHGEEAETVYTGYVVENNRLTGVVTAREMMLSSLDTPLEQIMNDNVISVQVTDDQEAVGRLMQKYNFDAVPVVDAEGMLVGIVTIDDAMDVLTEESTEDMQKMAAIVPEDAAATYFGTSVWQHAKQRIPWLLVLMLSATFTGMITSHYEATFAVLPLLVSFMPMLMDTPGNCGSQSCTLMVRGLALGEIETGDFLRVISKELRVALIVGGVLGLINGLRIYIMYGIAGVGHYDHVGVYALVVSVALFFSIMLAKLVGGVLPLAAKKLKMDPAIMASPLITTIVDAASLMIYFHVAQIFFSSLLH